MSGKAKVHLELNLAKDTKDKRGFFKDISSKRKTWANVGPLPNEVGALVTKGTEKAESLNTFAFYSLLRLALRNPRPWGLSLG